MKRILFAFCLFFAVFPAFAGGIRVLVVDDGSVDSEIIRHLVALAEADGSAWTVDVLASDSARPTGRYDAVVFASDTPSANIRRICRKTRGARQFVLQDWACTRNYSGEPCVAPVFAEYGYDQQRMYEAMVGKSRMAARENGLEVIPVGTAVQDVRGTFDRDNITLDGVALNYSIGCYLAACTWYEAISGTDVTANAYDPGHLRPERRELAKAAAHAAVAHPYEVVDFGFRKLNKHYDEALVPEYELPDPLVMADGTPVKDAGQWYSERRPELLRLFESEMFGRAPGRPADLHFELVSCDDGAFAGTAVRKEVNIYFTKGKDHYMRLLLYVPKDAAGKVPVILGANFKGNAAVTYDTGISLPDSAQIARYGVYKEPVRGAMDGRWPVGMILARGYALATFFKGDIDPEFDDSFRNGVHGLFYRDGQTYPDPDEWGTIAAWAWGYSRALDYLETDPDVDATRVSTVGHSRLAKTALWAAVVDPRFAMAYPNNSGCGGVALSRRAFGETLETIIRHYHYWFCANFWKYACHESEMPFDQHELLALMAPRPVYVASGEHDNWSDPKGEFLSVVEASKVYDFLGLGGVGVTEMPGPWKPQNTGRIGYHMRSGPHDITTYDWAKFLDFADRFLKP